jgi:4-amino-4-deoxy-L-arabinose transferase-like glycosyltransferase
LLLGASTSALFVLQALTLAGLATLTYHLGRRLLPKALAAAAGMGVIALPLALKLSLHVMSDVLLALLCLWAAILWAWYLRMPSIRRALVWGCVAAAAILTKGSGIGLCLLPPVATLLAGKWRLALTGSWWCSALPVAVLAAPWMLYSTGISKEGMTQLSPWQYFLQAVPYHLKAIPAVFGWPFTLLASAGIVGGLITGWRRKALLPETASLAGMAFGMTAVLLLVPVGLSTRYMLTLAPAMLLAAAAALHWFPWRGNVALLGKALSIFACNLLLIPPGILLRKEVNGFHAAVARSGISSDWMGRGYHTAFNTPKELLEHLDRLNITRVFLDQSMPTNQRTAHERLLEAALDGAKAAWALDFEQTVSRSPWENGRMRIYQRL